MPSVGKFDSCNQDKATKLRGDREEHDTCFFVAASSMRILAAPLSMNFVMPPASVTLETTQDRQNHEILLTQALPAFYDTNTNGLAELP